MITQLLHLVLQGGAGLYGNRWLGIKIHIEELVGSSYPVACNHAVIGILENYPAAVFHIICTYLDGVLRNAVQVHIEMQCVLVSLLGEAFVQFTLVELHVHGVIGEISEIVSIAH